jgi:hypothetical protein
MRHNPLTTTTWYEREEVVRLLLQRGDVDLNVSDKHSYTLCVYTLDSVCTAVVYIPHRDPFIT